MEPANTRVTAISGDRELYEAVFNKEDGVELHRIVFDKRNIKMLYVEIIGVKDMGYNHKVVYVGNEHGCRITEYETDTYITAVDDIDGFWNLVNEVEKGKLLREVNEPIPWCEE